jgi:hypothetical protein
MQTSRSRPKEIKTIKELYDYSYEPNEIYTKKDNIRYIDLSPPLDEIPPTKLASFKYWERGRKKDYEL